MFEGIPHNSPWHVETHPHTLHSHNCLKVRQQLVDTFHGFATPILLLDLKFVEIHLKIHPISLCISEM